MIVDNRSVYYAVEFGANANWPGRDIRMLSCSEEEAKERAAIMAKQGYMVEAVRVTPERIPAREEDGPFLDFIEDELPDVRSGFDRIAVMADPDGNQWVMGYGPQDRLEVMERISE
jgi:hypothetical protein